MIKFSDTVSQFDKNGESREFISVHVFDGTDIVKVKEHIYNQYESLIGSIYDFDRDEILFEIKPDIEYGFCMNQLIITVNEVAKAEVTWFALDLNEPTQRWTYNESA